MSTCSSGKRILIADDNEDALTVTSTLLRLQGYEVLAVDDGREAVAAVSAFRPDMVILDINMPGLDGYQAAAAVRRQPGAPAPLIVALTARNEPADVERAYAAGFDRHIVKPATALTASVAALFEANDPRD